MQFILRWVLTSLALSCAVWLVPGITVMGSSEAWVTMLAVGLVLTLINMSIKPILQTLALPFTVLTLGIFYLVVNATMLELSSWLATSLFHTGLYMESFFSAFIGAIIVSIASGILNVITGGIAND